PLLKGKKISYRVFSKDYSPLKELVAIQRQYNISEEKWMAILKSLQDEDVETVYPGNARVGQCVFAYKCDNNKKKDALKRELIKRQDEKVGLRARVEELEKSLRQHCSHNSVTELKASLTKIEELKRKIEELELGVALQNCELRVELLEMNNEHWKEQLQRSQG
ncbi:hypothetical protein Goklo_006669, partial [Gossypium klotzschianum]|nr:hypothetical protein [Gossypium klotzschianum]